LHPVPLEWHYLCTKFHENLPSGSEVISGGHRQPDRQTERETAHLINLLSFLESRLKKRNYTHIPLVMKKAMRK
jgi:hypothetical protein